MMIQAKALAEQADNELRMKKAWKYLDDIQHQLEAGP